MEFRIWVETRLAGRALERRLVAQVNREATGIGPEDVDLTLEEGKTVLRQVQAGVIQIQAEALEVAQRPCLHCGRKQRIKDRRNPYRANRIWRGSSVLPPVPSLPVSRRNESHSMAARPPADAGYDPGASIPLRLLG
jgi:hypothetical protein